MLTSGIIALLFGLASILVLGIGGLAITFSVVNMLGAYLITYLFTPTIAYGFYEFPFWLMVFGIALFFELGLVTGVRKLLTRREANRQPPSFTKSSLTPIKYGAAITIAVVGAAFFTVVPWFATTTFFDVSGYGRTADYRALIGEVKTDLEFQADVPHIDPSQVRLVTQTMAKRLASTKLGEDQGLASQFEVGNFNISIVMVDDTPQLYWVAPLEWTGFLRWLNRTSPGYVKVSATNQRDVELVTSVNGKLMNLRYLPSAWMGDQITRYIWNKGFVSTGFYDLTFELDDNGRPFYVGTKYAPSIGYSGEVITGIIILDPETGEIVEKSVNDAPKWVDRIVPETFADNRIEWWGEYVHGAWNLSNKDKLKATPGTSLVLGANGEALWYTGIQSTTSGTGGTTGFMLMNTRTGATSYYKQAGITEQDCSTNIAGLVAEKEGWSVSACILYNIGGEASYIAVIVDSAGNPKQVGIASVQYRDVVVSHEDIRGAIRKYNSSLRNKGTTSSSDVSFDAVTIEASISRIGSETLDGNTVYYIVLRDADKLFTASAGLSPWLPVAREGDGVIIKYIAIADGKVQEVVEFTRK